MTKTEDEALRSLTALCARGERCTGDMTAKMRQWGLDDDAQARIMAYLTDHRFVDDMRFSRAFVAEKIRLNKWGPKKIDQALAAKGVDAATRHAALGEVDPQRYEEALRPLLAAKRMTISAADDYEANGKLIRFALSRGFEMETIRKCISSTTY